jgi:nucleotide-binding universal stress UspA family protein
MVRFVLPLLQHYRAEATILHVIEVPAPVPAEPLPNAFGLLGLTDELLRSAEERLKQFQFPVELPPTIDRLSVRGEPHDCILQAAREHNSDLIAMATRGFGPLRRFLLGSVTAKVLDEATVPILTGAHLREHPSIAQFHRIICAVDLDDHAPITLRFAKELAQDYSAEIHVVHAIEMESATAILDAGSEQQVIQLAFDRLEGLAKDVGLDCELHVEIGLPNKVVPQLAERLGSDVLVVGRSVRGKPGFLRTNAYALIRESPCAVLSV